ncbi:Mitochondrial import inner membrane translocase subunit TIM50-C [Operophtera brumata]|uniref:Mitochondrial import inner membrane translocase subunit TIM50-C n=1 Tax=Operophtera brumata TaxID=104452 RepID=A0A0L7L0V2_OPEBR|nr:Mitochondrial import inner membrane translocase subunit TIM50-C [Operophtera brumata]
MSLKKILILAKPICCKVSSQQTTNFAVQKNWLLAANFYSTGKLGSSNEKKDAKGEKVDILGRFFPQTPLNTDDAQAIKNEQERFEKENKEKAEENQKSKLIEDEFSHLPTAMQYLRRTWKELTFYEKVR